MWVFLGLGRIYTAGDARHPALMGKNAGDGVKRTAVGKGF
jgi:hypothetical protein